MYKLLKGAQTLPLTPILTETIVSVRTTASIPIRTVASASCGAEVVIFLAIIPSYSYMLYQYIR